MKALKLFCRYIIGITFIFSGFVKGVDPLGTMYRIEDYLTAYHLQSFSGLALTISFALILVEFLLGTFLLLNIKMKITSRVLLLMMSFFTLTTLYDAIYDPVPDCGCFGDAIKLTNKETFYKNVVLMILTFLLIIPKKGHQKNRTKNQTSLLKWISAGAIILIFAFFCNYNYRHLPVIDFRAWKVGNDMKKSGKPTYYLIYKNNNTGERQEFLSSEIPWSDSLWMKQWSFENNRIDNSDVILPHNLFIFDLDGNDLSQDIIENPSYQFIISAPNINDINKKNIHEILDLYKQFHSDYEFVLLTASLEEVIGKFKKEFQCEDLLVCHSDDVELKAMIRSSPGLLLLHNGIVIKKWHHHDIPDSYTMLNKYLINRPN